MSRLFEFNPEKALAATAYLANETGESMYPLLKMLYLVDRLHLERYARPVTGDRYVAMQEGPTASEVYDWMKFLRGERQYSTLPEAREFLEVERDTHMVTVKKMPHLAVLSATDMECLDAIIAIFRERGSWYIREMSHDAAWKATARNREMDVMTIAASLQSGPALAQHLIDRFQGNAQE